MEEEKQGRGTSFLDKAQDTVGGMVGTANAAIGGGSTSAFLENARIGDMYEIEASQIALARSGNPEVREVAQHIIADHTTSSHQLKSTLRMNETIDALGDVTIPSGLDTRRATMIDHLHKASDADFDRTYIDQQTLAHQETITLFESYASRGDIASLASFARGTLPGLRQHAKMVSAVQL